MNRHFAGALAGLVATAPMTVTMFLLHRRLNWLEKHPLPPEEITTKVTNSLGLNKHLKREEHQALIWLNHFAFGAAMGPIYAPLAEKVKAPPYLKGAAFGLLVWLISYRGWLPVTGLLDQPREQSTRSNLLMVVAHLVWGASLGVLNQRWKTN